MRALFHTQKGPDDTQNVAEKPSLATTRGLSEKFTSHICLADARAKARDVQRWDNSNVKVNHTAKSLCGWADTLAAMLKMGLTSAGISRVLSLHPRAHGTEAVPVCWQSLG